ncbi:hypothetical protein [Hydrogenobacter hydrogenophilus]|uniref:hypothetical protein n=1 Tax=Hydrogenobacter hydrogenophilus TaxID=35835 RepID=UPI0015DFA3CB|nr:hypothetical protein [Hydrogenobacter hydrogenophilus]
MRTLVLMVILALESPYQRDIQKKAFEGIDTSHKEKRLFRMAPFHHHLELSGIPEPKIVVISMLKLR